MLQYADVPPDVLAPVRSHLRTLAETLVNTGVPDLVGLGQYLGPLAELVYPDGGGTAEPLSPGGPISGGPGTPAPPAPSGSALGLAGALSLEDPYAAEALRKFVESPPLQVKLGEGSGASVLPYAAQTAPDPYAEARSALRRSADALKAQSNPLLIQLGEQLGQAAEHWYPPGTPAERGGQIPVTALPPVLRGLLALTKELPRLPARIGGVWTDLDGARGPAVAPVQADGTVRVNTTDLSVVFGTPRTSTGETVSAPLMILIPRVHLLVGEEISSTYLLPSWLWPPPAQVMLSTSLAVGPVAAREIGWWPGTALQDALKQTPAAPAMVVMNVSGVPTFNPATQVASATLSAGCLVLPAGATFIEPDRPRTVAPVPALDAGRWPAAATEGVPHGQVMLDERDEARP